jgi:hypothetical protein
MKKPVKYALLPVTAAIALLSPATPAHAATMNTNLNACSYNPSSWAYSSTHQAYIRACIYANSTTIHATTEIYNDGAGADYTVTAQLRRSSDTALIASDNCTAYVYGASYAYCTKAWPRGSGTFYAAGAATRSGASGQALAYSGDYTT